MTGSPASPTKTVNAVSGTKAAYTLTKANLESWLGTTTTTGLSWNLTASDGSYTSAPSTTCQFTFDPTRPGAPTVNDAVGTDCSESAANYQVGTAANFSLVPNSKGTAPDHYLYQLNGAAPVSTKTPDVTIKPTRGTNILNVTSVSPGGNIGDTATCVINASAAATAPDGDLTGDGVPDLTLVGGQAQLPPGLWLAHGAPKGHITAASQIGAQGTGKTAPGAPDDWNGLLMVSGHFHTGAGFNDILSYDPALHTGWILYGSGDGSALTPSSGNQMEVSPPIFQNGATGNYATAIASGGGLYNAANDYDPTGFPDLLLVVDGNLVDEPSAPFTGAFGGFDTDMQSLSSSNPAGSGDWTNWTITSSLIDGLPALFARSPSGGPVYYYSPDAMLALAKGGSATPLALTISSSASVLEGGDLDSNGTPDLWQIAPDGTVTADLLTLADTPQLTPQTPQKVATGTHQWRLDDASDGNVTTSADATGNPALPLIPSATAGAAVTWDNGDLFDPDLQLSGTAFLQTTTKAIDLTGSLTVSVWAEPSTLNGAVFSQSGSSYSGIKLVPTASGWQFSLNTGAGTAGAYDTVTGGTVHLGTWTHLTATYDKTIKVMNLYVDDVFVATGSHTAPSTGATGPFVVGANQNNSTSPSGYFTGHLSDVQTWTGAAVPPTQASTPASYHQAITSTRILDTRYSSGLANTTGVTAGTATIPANSTTTLNIAGDSVTSTAGTPVTVPSSVTAVAIDVTAVNQTASGYVTAYADSSQRPITSSTNFTAASTTTGYQIVPVGTDGKIDLFTHGSAVALVVDMTGYFTTDPALPGNQTYTPLAPATRALDTRTSTANTNLTSTGTVPGDSTFTLTIAGVDGVPSDAAAVAINLTTADATGSGYLQAYATGATPAAATSLSYDTSSALASMAADTPIGTGGTITISNHHSATAVLVDIAGYYTDDTDGQTYHPVNPTRLVDTRNGTGGTGQPIPAYTTYTLAQADVQQITTATTPTLALMLTEATATAAGHADAYPAGTAANNTSNLDWAAGAINANLALTPTSAGSEISVDNHSNGTLDLVIDCSGYFSR